MAFALCGITAVLAPIIGPTLGGWITYSYSWRWIFYINFPVGILAAFLVLRMVEDPPYLSLMRSAGVRLDYIGLGFLSAGIGALQVVLDKGQEDDWCGSRFILTLFVIAAVCLPADPDGIHPRAGRVGSFSERRYSTKRIDLDISFSVAMWLRVAQTAGLPFLFVSITLASYVGIRPEKSNHAAGLINFMRNIGSSVGTSMVTTMRPDARRQL